MVVWKERQHEDDDAKSEDDAASIASLQGHGLLNFFYFPNMRSQVRLMEYMLRMWNPEKIYFEVGTHLLIVEVEEIYFLTGLSKRVEHISQIGPRGWDLPT